MRLFGRSLLCCASAFALLSLASPANAQTDKKAVVEPGKEASLEKLPFTQGIIKGDTLYVSGQAGFGPKGRPENFDDEVKVALDNVGKYLKLAGYSYADVVSSTVYLTDIGNIEEMNKIYMSYFPVPRPARATVQVAKLVSNARFEIMVTARK
jgi:2-iminobutanoate/2-iminopropanoate deaminase